MGKSNGKVALTVRRWKERTGEACNSRFRGLTIKMAYGMLGTGGFGWTRFIPPKPRVLGRWARPPVWPDDVPAVPEVLRSYPGVLRDERAEAASFEAAPLHDFNQTHIEAVTYMLGHSWTWLLPPYPALRRALLRLDRARRMPRAARRPDLTADELASTIREFAKSVGLSEVGFAKAELRYTFAEFPAPAPDENIVVCLLEQDWRATNTAPSSRSERAAFRGYGQLQTRVAQLVEHIKGLGYDARGNEWGGLEALAIHYGVEAGLGQLGLNGQLLTPRAGSRVRIGLITTNAPMTLGQAHDFGMPRICDECQLCVKRCPPGAIPIGRKEKRGITKAAIKPERCYPIVAQAHGCAVCMKVCPIQRYGLEPVISHFETTGEILGKGTDELEGYVWPLDSRYYGPNEKPRISTEIMNPPGWFFDKTRTAPVPRNEQTLL